MAKKNNNPGPVQEKNILAEFLESDNDNSVEKNEAAINDHIDEDGFKQAPDKFKDLPRKYWKHQ